MGVRGKGAKGIHNWTRIQSKTRGIQMTVKRVRLETKAYAIVSSTPV
jgi:hypothetical protein